MFFKSKSSKPTPPKAVPTKSFHEEFPTLSNLLRRFPLSNPLAWPEPEEIEFALKDYSANAPEDLERAMTFYSRDYDSRSGTTFREAMYRPYAVLAHLPKFKEAFPKSLDLANRVGVPVGSIWPSPDIVRAHIEDKSLVNIQALHQALTLYSKAYKLEMETSFLDIMYQIHNLLTRE